MNMHLDNRYLNVLGQINLDDLHIQQTFDYYQKQYEKNMLAQQFVLTSIRISDELRLHPEPVFCDRTMGSQIPPRRTFEGGAIRGSLQRCGLIRASGHELFRGCVIFPIKDVNGNIISATGYRITSRLRDWDTPIVLWRKPEPDAFIDLGMSKVKEILHDQTYH
jgi:hypothetical protein